MTLSKEIGVPLPILLPEKAIPAPGSVSHFEWTPRRYLSEPQPPPPDDAKLQELEMAAARQILDGKIVKKTRPRRTVDYNGGLGRWALVSISICDTRRVCLMLAHLWLPQLRKLRPNPTYVPYMRPSPPYIIDV